MQHPTDGCNHLPTKTFLKILALLALIILGSACYIFGQSSKVSITPNVTLKVTDTYTFQNNATAPREVIIVKLFSSQSGVVSETHKFVLDSGTSYSLVVPCIYDKVIVGSLTHDKVHILKNICPETFI